MNSIYNLNRKNIWNEAQNKPSLIVDDIVKIYPDIDRNVIYEILLRRGVFKWLNVRRELIKLKNEWKIIVRDLSRKKTKEEKGFYKAVLMCRKDVRGLCHSDRWACPDFDTKANIFLNEYQKEG